jgi:hypothetical protein
MAYICEPMFDGDQVMLIISPVWIVFAFKDFILERKPDMNFQI